MPISVQGKGRNRHVTAWRALRGRCIAARRFVAPVHVRCVSQKASLNSSVPARQPFRRRGCEPEGSGSTCATKQDRGGTGAPCPLLPRPAPSSPLTDQQRCRCGWRTSGGRTLAHSPAAPMAHKRATWTRRRRPYASGWPGRRGNERCGGQARAACSAPATASVQHAPALGELRFSRRISKPTPRPSGLA